MLEIQERNMMNGERFHVRRGTLSFAPAELDIAVSPGEVHEDSFVVSGGDGAVVSGFVCSSSAPMKVLTETFSGAREVIGCRFDAAGFAPGDHVEGRFVILSDQGEYELPFHVTVRVKLPDSSLGVVRSLTHYVNLARTSWQEAVSVFYQPAFAQVLSEDPACDDGVMTLYRGLSARPGNEHNVEEFLIAAGAKEAVVLSADCRELAMELSYREEKPVIRRIRIRRNGWGYTRARVSCSGDFLDVSAQELCGTDYAAGEAVLSLCADPGRMHAGRNFGRIILTPDFGEEIVIAVTASWYVDTALRSLHRREEKQLVLQMTQEYIAFRGKKISSEVFSERMGSVVRRLKEADRLSPLTALYHIHYLLTLHQGQDALWELQALCRRQYGLDGPLPEYPLAQFDLEDDLIYSYRLYLTILCAQECSPDSIETAGIARDASQMIGTMHRRNPDSFWITWLLLYADPDYSRRPSTTLQMLQEHYRRGCRSPFLYLEIWQMIRISPTLLYELGDLELQVLLFAAKYGLLTDSVMVRVNDLAIRRKTFSARLLRVLSAAYEMDVPETRRREILESICTLLIRGNMTDSRYHMWYRLGVEQGLGITRLMDYFMLSLPAGEDSPLPQIVLLYYSYQNTLPDVQSAHLYRYVLENRVQNEGLYIRYAERIDRFTLDQLSQRRISTDLAYLYECYLLSGRVLSGEQAAAAVQAVFTCRIRSARPEMHRAVLVYDHLLPETYCPLTDGIGYLPVYGGGCRIFLEDDAGRRLAVSMESDTDRMMDYQRLFPPLLIYDIANSGFDLYLTERALAPQEGAPGAKASAEEAAQADGNDGTGSAGNVMGPLMEGDANTGGVKGPVTEGDADAGSARDQAAAGDASSGNAPGPFMEGSASSGGPVTAGNADRWQSLALSTDIPESYRRQIRRHLIQYYETTGDADGLCALLQSVDPDGIGCAERARLLQVMTVQGLYEQAFSWVQRFGTDGVDGNVLLRLAGGVQSNRLTVPEDVLAGIAWDAFSQGFYDGAVLKELAEHWDGRTQEMEKVREAAAGFDIDDGVLGRRMLTQMLFTGESVPFRAQLLESCVRNGEETSFLADVLAQASHFYYVCGEEMSGWEFDRIAEFGMEGTPILDICRIAWLKDRSERSGETSDRDMEITGLFLSDLIGEGVIFPFFRQFIGLQPGLESYADETFIEYHAGRRDPKAKVLLHYAAERGGIREPYAAKEMKEMYEGIYVTGFLLFFGEQLHYYITDDVQEKNVVESGTIGQDARIMTSGTDRFGCINEIAMLTALGRDDEAIAKMDEYGRKSFLVSRLFED